MDLVNGLLSPLTPQSALQCLTPLKQVVAVCVRAVSIHTLRLRLQELLSLGDRT